MKNQEYEAKLLNLPYPKSDQYGALSMPVYNSLAFEFETAEEMEAAFCGITDGHTYSRVTNPTVQHYEDCVKAITGAYGVTALNSGMAAISNVFFSLAWSGSNLITSRKLFGNTYSYFVNTLSAFGIEVRFCDLTNPDEVAGAIDENSCGVFAEIIANPQMEIVDLEMLSKVAHDKKVPLIADTTLIPFSYFRAVDFGVDIEVVSSTKYISGGGTSLGGLIIDYGKFDWKNSKRLKLVAEDCFSAFHVKLRKEVHRNLGAYMNPQTAYMQILGLESMNIRYVRQASTCMQLAEKLSTLPSIKMVNYPGLKSNPYHEVSCKQFGEYHGAMMTFDLDSRECCFKFLNRLKLIHRATNLFDNRSLIIHPASTIYGNFTPELRASIDVKDTTIRLSVGLEDVDSLFDDIRQALLF